MAISGALLLAAAIAVTSKAPPVYICTSAPSALVCQPMER